MQEQHCVGVPAEGPAPWFTGLILGPAAQRPVPVALRDHGSFGNLYG